MAVAVALTIVITHGKLTRRPRRGATWVAALFAAMAAGRDAAERSIPSEAYR
jgi:hypothetical protein